MEKSLLILKNVLERKKINSIIFDFRKYFGDGNNSIVFDFKNVLEMETVFNFKKCFGDGNGESKPFYKIKKIFFPKYTPR